MLRFVWYLENGLYFFRYLENGLCCFFGTWKMYFFQYLENGLHFFGHFWEEQKTSNVFDFGEVKFCYFSEEKCAAGADFFFS